MKRLFYFLLLWGGFSACEGDVNPRGEASATLNGNRWIATSAIVENFDLSGQERLVFFLDRPHGKYDAMERLFFRVPFTIGKHRVLPYDQEFPTERNRASFTLIQSDISMDRFDVLETPEEADREVENPLDIIPSFLEIESIDGNRIRGRFQATMVRTPSFENKGFYPSDTLRFTEGEFTVYLEE